MLALARSFREPLLLALTFRDDDLTREHPFRRRLAQLDGRVGVSRGGLGGRTRIDPPLLTAVVGHA